MQIQNKIVPNLWFKGVAEEAVNFYLSIFPESKILKVYRYPSDESVLLDFQKSFAGKVLTIEFEIFGQKYVAINAGNEFTFNEAISLAIFCKDQDEIDYYWEKLTADGGEESMCGWCKDKYGLSWQVAPENIDALVEDPKSFSKMLKIKKIIIKDLQK
jgi:predicted 3-demethylubiquinone-9 3-methyltransferase (glyoxalase superfamily)